MTNHVAVDSRTHRRTRVITTPSAAFGDSVGAVSVIPAEFNALLAHYPIFFRKNGESGRFEPSVLLGFSGRENLFLENGRWDARYAPLEIQRRPFSVRARSGDDLGEHEAGLVLTLDMDSPRVQEREGEILFLETGERSRYLERVSSALRALTEGAAIAHAYAQKLAELDLIEPVRLEAEFIDGSDVALEGLYAVRAEALRKLGGADLGALQAAGYLEWAYWQSGSLVHVADLIARKNRRLAGATAA